MHRTLDNTRLKFEDEQVVWCALKDYVNAQPIKGKTKQAGFPDALVINKAKHYGQLNNIEITHIYAFNKATFKIGGTKEP